MKFTKTQLETLRKKVETIDKKAFKIKNQICFQSGLTCSECPFVTRDLGDCSLSIINREAWKSIYLIDKKIQIIRNENE